mgnify:CR=1 FL=1
MEDLRASCQLRLAVLDIDGTLTDPTGDITPPVQAAVAALLQRDILVLVATGRNLAEMEQVWEAWPQLTRVTYSNGAAIAGMGLAPLWVSDMIRESVTGIIAQLMS